MQVLMLIGSIFFFAGCWNMLEAVHVVISYEDLQDEEALKQRLISRFIIVPNTYYGGGLMAIFGLLIPGEHIDLNVSFLFVGGIVLWLSSLWIAVIDNETVTVFKRIYKIKDILSVNGSWLIKVRTMSGPFYLCCLHTRLNKFIARITEVKGISKKELLEDVHKDKR